jgi:hypothetical protein
MNLASLFCSWLVARESALARSASSPTRTDRPADIAILREETSHAVHVRLKAARERRLRAPQRASDDPALRPGLIELMLISGAR